MPPPMWHIRPHFVRVPLKGGNPVLSIERERERERERNGLTHSHWSQAESMCDTMYLCAMSSQTEIKIERERE